MIMKKIFKNRYIQFIAILIIGLLLGWIIKPTSERSNRGSSEEVVSNAEEQIWTCSMHPQIRQKEPGDCPICGMDLIPLESNDQKGIAAEAVSMSPTAMQLANVSTAEVGEMVPVKKVRLNGKVQEDERLVSSQSSHIPGRIERLLVNFTGEYIQKGQVIAHVYSPELVTAQQELFEAQKIMDTQPKLFQSAREKLKKWKLSEGQIDQILESGKTKEVFPITSDVSGFVLNKNVNRGDYIKRGEPIYEVAGLSRVWVLFDVYESDLPWINRGDDVEFTVQSLPAKKFTAQISFLDPVIDPVTRVAKARVEVSNKNNRLKPEMFASGVVNASLNNREYTMVIPKSSVMWTGERSIVYVKTTSDQGVHFMMREVVLGPALGESYVLESGLEIGEEIAVSGTFSIDAAAQLAGKPSMMNPYGGGSGTSHDHGKMEIKNTPGPEKVAAIENISLNQKAKEALQPLYNDYLELKNALVSDDKDLALDAALGLNSTLNKVSMSDFEGKAHNAWMRYSNSLEESLQHAQHQNSIEGLRKLFQRVSEVMISMTKTFRPVDNTLYIQHCPMADNDKGADWLSTEEEVMNPYFGATMLKCGWVKEELY